MASLYEVVEEARAGTTETRRLVDLRKLHSLVSSEFATLPEDKTREAAGIEKVCAQYRQEAKALEAWYPAPPAVQRAADGFNTACSIQAKQGGSEFRAALQRSLLELESLLVNQAHLALEARERAWWRRLFELGGLAALLASAIGALFWWRRAPAFEPPREPEARATSNSSPPQWMRAAIESSPEGVLLVERSGEIRAANPAAEKLLGWPRQELIGRPVSDVLPAFAGLREESEPRGEWLRTAVRPREGAAPFARDVSWFRREDPFQSFTILHVHPADASGAAVAPYPAAPTVSGEAASTPASAAAPGDVDIESLQHLENQILLVTGYGEVALANLAAGDPMRADIEQLARAGSRAALLCRQATLRPATAGDRQPLGLNTFLKSFEQRLRALTGPEADILRRADPVAGSVQSNPELLEETLLGLALHAMPSIREPLLIRLSSSLSRIEMSLHTRGAVNLAWRPEPTVKPARARQWLEALEATLDHEVADKGGHRFRIHLPREAAAAATNGVAAHAAHDAPEPPPAQDHPHEPETAASPSAQ